MMGKPKYTAIPNTPQRDLARYAVNAIIDEWIGTSGVVDEVRVTIVSGGGMWTHSKMMKNE